MSSDLYARAKSIVQQAAARPVSERPAFVDRECAGDAALRREVDSWLSASDDVGVSSDAPAVKMCKTCDTTFPGAVSKFCPKCAQPLVDDPRALVGSQLDNLYQIEALLGQGGMGAVYRARHALLGDRVAIKTLKRELSENPQILKRFQREGQAARSFHHPNAVTVHDLRMTASGLLYMVLEYIDGTDVRGLLRSRGRLSLGESLEILGPLADVLDVAHAAGVVHRDLKPENVMVASIGRDGSNVKLLDLGIAKLLEPVGDEPATELTAIDQVLGTPPYMSPEQWGMPQKDGLGAIDRRADVYSLAVMTYEMLAGAWPYPGRTVDDCRIQHISSPVPDAHSHYTWVPEGVARVLSRGLAKDRSERHATAGAFFADLERAANGSNVGSPSATLVTGPGTYRVATEPALDRQDLETLAARDSARTQEQVAPPVPPTIVDAPPSSASPPSINGRRPSKLALSVGGIVLILVVVALGFVRFARTPRASSPAANTSTVTIPDTSTTQGSSTATEPAEALRYWVESRNANGEVQRSTGADALSTAREFRFHLVAQSAGYVYVLGPNEREVLTLLYSGGAKPPLAKGEEFVFPQGGWAKPTPGSSVDHVTFVFSPAPIGDAKYLSANPPHSLTPDELRSFDALRHASLVDASNVRVADGATSMRVLSATQDRPVIFDLTLVHGP